MREYIKILKSIKLDHKIKRFIYIPFTARSLCTHGVIPKLNR